MKDLINKLKDLRNVAQTLQTLDKGDMPTPQELQKTMESTLGVSIEELIWTFLPLLKIVSLK
mgnify:CR=1 FL=1